MAPPKRTNKSKPAQDDLAYESDAAYLRKLRMRELTDEFSRQERELKKLARRLGKRLTGN